MRPVPLQLIRIILMFLALFFAHFLGRAIVRLRRQKLPYTKGLTWLLRTTVALFGIIWMRGFDLLSILALLLCAAALAAGIWVENRHRKVEEIHLFSNEDRMG